MFSEKYLAGFIDADGHFSVRARIGARPDLEFSLAQEGSFIEPLLYMKEEFGGYIREKSVGNTTYHEFQQRGGPARKTFERLKKYLVLKKTQVEDFLDLVDNGKILRSKEDVQAVRQRVKDIRKYGARSQPNYPSRKWMAGYIDGDGCFSCVVKAGIAYPTLAVLAAPNYLVGITLLQKAFGGNICGTGENAIWTLYLTDPSKVRKVLGFCGPHLHKKKAQAYFILGCANKGNLRDGEAIRRTIRDLNSQQHRLSESTAEAHRRLQGINFNVPKKRMGRPPKRQSEH